MLSLIKDKNKQTNKTLQEAEKPLQMFLYPLLNDGSLLITTTVNNNNCQQNQHQQPKHLGNADKDDHIEHRCETDQSRQQQTAKAYKRLIRKTNYQKN